MGGLAANAWNELDLNVNLMDNNMTRITVGIVAGWAVRERELILRVLLSQPLSSEWFLEREPHVTDRVADSRDGDPLATKIEPRFSGVQEPGKTIEISLLDRDAVNPGVPEANGPRFVGEALTILVPIAEPEP